MEITSLQTELASNVMRNKTQIADLFKAYEIAKLGYEVQRQQEKDIYNRVLVEHEFYCNSDDCMDLGLKKGDRIIDEDFLFVLTKDENALIYQYAMPYFIAEQITDENGFYITNWLTIEVERKKELVAFVIDNVLPVSMRKDFEKARTNVVYQDKLLAIIDKMFVKNV